MARAIEEVGRIQVRFGTMPMKTKTESVIYYLYFASQKPVAANIVDAVFNNYRKRQGL